MRCDFKQAATESHKSGRAVFRCCRCKRRGLLPPSGKILDLHADCKSWPHPHELGHWLTLLLEACFIRKRDYLWLKAKLGLAPSCGCGERAEKLNTWGAAIRRWLNKKPGPVGEARP